MKTVLSIACALLLPLTQPPAAVSGRVIDAVSKEPVSGARVLLARIDPPIESSVVVEADDRGRFVARDVPDGRYRVFVDEPGFMRLTAVIELVVRGGRAAVGDVAMIRAAVIAGRVTNERGYPVPNVYVRAATDKGRVIEARTNDLGDYRLFGLAPGTYVVSAERYTAPRIEGANYIGPTPPCPDCPGEGAFRQQVAGLAKTGAYIDPRVIENRASTTIYFPGTSDRAAATPVRLEAGATAAGIDFRIK
jgi:hypothetical protein